ncbi:hypothetical protein [Pectobacterium sp. CFBP8739]|uniref:hypothetical protein n=1 Tax=Pectobacterium sp. CFBP8739 TaxID=2748908 RepID=UPI0015DFE182|nr:hypothetical protein [Pectobacterium sp. CFBP8739]MBA0167855.1 hypothetical protein [Pectobacterium sp. CFBP8739]
MTRASKFIGYNAMSRSLDFIYEKNNQPFGITFWYDDDLDQNKTCLYRDERTHEYTNADIGTSEVQLHMEMTSIPFLREFFEVNDDKELDKLKKDIHDIIYSHLRDGLSLTEDLGFEKYKKPDVVSKPKSRKYR